MEDATDRRRIHALFDAALELGPEEREKYLDRACGDDAAQRDAVVELLDAAEPGEDPELARYPHLLEALGTELTGPPVEGRWIGPYRVLERVGRGGMGSVFLAERADGSFERRVAIKVLPWIAATSELTGRFTIERQILADLDHPHVARLVDGGATEDGLPYLVMEHVEGEPIDRYCEENDLSVRERLELFLNVCDGVLSAHQNMVVHRDLKPSNILVTSDGTPKLLDFGIAKLLDAAPSATLTRAEARPLTPAYAAPEQLRGDPVSARTDVYGLGCLLYLLLAGRPPHELEGISLAQIERRVCEVGPPPPSAAVETEGTGPGPPKELDAIVLQAMAVEPSRRYRTVEAMMADIRRYLAGEPVMAHPAGLAYRTRKFVRRNAAAVAAVVLVFTSLLAVLALTVRQLHIEEEQRQSAQQMSRFLADLLTVVDPDSGTGATLDARVLLDRGVREARAKLAEQPALRADSLAVLAKAAYERGLHDRAAEIGREVLELRRRLLGPAAPETLETADRLAWALAWAGRGEEAGALLHETIDLSRRHHGELSEAHAAAVHSRGSLAVSFPGPSMGNREGEVEATLRQALRIRRTLHGRDHPGIAAVLHDLAYVVADPEEKEGLLREALAMQRRVSDGPQEATARMANDLALQLESQGREAESIRLMREALDLHRSLLGDQHPVTIRILNNLAGVLRDAGRSAAAEDLYRQALELTRSLYPEDHVNLAFPLYGLGRVLLERRELAAAEEHLREAREILADAEDPLRHEAASAQGEALARLGRLHEARPLLEESQEALEGLEGFEAYARRAEARLELLGQMEAR